MGEKAFPEVTELAFVFLLPAKVAPLDIMIIPMTTVSEALHAIVQLRVLCASTFIPRLFASSPFNPSKKFCSCSVPLLTEQQVCDIGPYYQ
jgi:hypothetical protein